MRFFIKPLTRLLPLLICSLLLISCGDKDVAGNPATGAAEKSTVTLISNARIYTFDEGNTTFESGSMAFSLDGEILGIGGNEEMSRVFSDARQIDMSGKTLLPGLIDSHGHLYGLALSFTRANLTGTRDKAEVINRLREFSAELPPGEWLLGARLGPERLA